MQIKSNFRCLNINNVMPCICRKSKYSQTIFQYKKFQHEHTRSFQMSSFSWSIFQLPLYQLAGSGVQSVSRHFLRLVSFLGHSRPPSCGWTMICRCLEVQPRPHETEHGDHAPHSLTCKYFHKQSESVWNCLVADEALVLLLVQFPIGLQTVMNRYKNF